MNRTPASNQGFTLVELLVVIAIIAIIAGLVVPSLMNAQNSAYKLQDTSNLRGLQSSAFMYAQKKKKFPIAKVKEPRAHESVNVLLKSSAGADMAPEIFVSPVGSEIEADIDDEDKFLLEEENLSYAWLSKPTSTTKKATLACNKFVDGYDYDGELKSGYQNAIIVVDTSGKVIEVDMIDEEERNKYKIDEDTDLPRDMTR